MAKRVTIQIDEELDRRVREHQAGMMLASNKAYSYSAAVNDLLARNIGRASSMHPASGGEASGVAGNQGEDHDG